MSDQSYEARFWALATTASQSKITKSMMGKLAKLCQDYERAYRILSDSLKTHRPANYLGKVISNLKDEQSPPAINIPRSHEPEVALQARLRGWPVRKTTRTNGEPAWWVAGTLYDQGGVDVGW